VVGGHDDHDGDGGSIGDGHSIDHCRYRSIDRDGDGSSCFDHLAGRALQPATALARGRDPRH